MLCIGFIRPPGTESQASGASACFAQGVERQPVSNGFQASADKVHLRKIPFREKIPIRENLLRKWPVEPWALESSLERHDSALEEQAKDTLCCDWRHVRRGKNLISERSNYTNSEKGRTIRPKVTFFANPAFLSSDAK
jgi:hypothetical protein